MRTNFWLRFTILFGMSAAALACSSSDAPGTPLGFGGGSASSPGGSSSAAGTISVAGTTVVPDGGSAPVGAAGTSAGTNAGAASGGTSSGGVSSGGTGDSASTTGGSGGSALGGSGGSGGGGTAPANGVRVVGYLPNYSGSYSDWATKIDFTKMTHLNLAFALSNGQNGWDMGASDDEVKALVSKAHAAGCKVLASLGGGDGDQTVLKQYNTASNIAPLVNNLDAFLDRLSLDGADIDIESPENLGAPYSSFVKAVVDKLHPKGKLVTAAVAQYLQDNMSDDTLKSFDFVNIMVYTTYDDSASALDWYNTKKSIDKKKLVIGAGFFGTSDPYKEWAYKDILAADSSAWSKDVATVQGKTVHYTGVTTMQKIAAMSKDWGGIMFWELTEDAPGEHSLWKTIQDTM